MGIKDLNWMNNSYNKNNNNTGGGNTGGGNIDTSNFVKKQEFNESQNAQDVKINEAKATIDAIKENAFDNTNIKNYVYSKNATDQLIGDTEVSIKKQVDEKLALKQNNLTAGKGIEIKNNIISLSAALAGPDMTNYYTKPETNNLISPINNRVDEAYTKIRENNNNITKLQNEKQDKLIAGNGITIYENIIHATNRDLNNYYTKQEIEDMIFEMEMTSSISCIKDFRSKALLVFEISTDNIKLQDFIGNLPSEIASWRNISNIESAMVNAINGDGDILSKQLDLLIGHYNGRLFIKSYGELPSDVKKIRFRIWVNKK